MKILNLTQHKCTKDQIEAGVVDATEQHQQEIAQLLTFEEIPSEREMYRRAFQLLIIAFNEDADAVMIAGAPYFMAPLSRVMTFNHVKVLYAFSKRESVEIQNADGTVSKSNIFKHIGFVGLDHHHPEYDFYGHQRVFEAIIFEKGEVTADERKHFPINGGGWDVID